MPINTNRTQRFGPNCVLNADLSDLSALASVQWTAPNGITGVVKTPHGLGMQFTSASNEYIDCGTSPIFNLTDEVTLEAWVFSANFAPPAQVLVKDFAYALMVENNRIRGLVNTAAGWGASTLNGATPIVNNSWNHILMTYESTGANERVFLNGAQDNTQVLAGAMVPNAVTVKFAGNAFCLNGIIDSCRIYNRALDIAEIQALYNAGIGTFPAFGRYDR